MGQTDYWQQHLKESDVASWRGIAFEEVCLQHISQIKYALHIGAVSSQESSLIVKGSEEADGMQIDLLIDRADDAVNVCELTFYTAPYAVTTGYAQVLTSLLQTLEAKHPTNTFLLPSLVHSALVSHEYSDVFRASVSINDLVI